MIANALKKLHFSRILNVKNGITFHPAKHDIAMNFLSFEQNKQINEPQMIHLKMLTRKDNFFVTGIKLAFEELYFKSDLLLI